MAEEEKKKFSLRNIFRRKALPPVPQEYLDDKNVRKAVRRYEHKRSMKVLKRAFLAAALGSTALSGITTLNPDLVSTKFDDYMAAKGYESNLSAHYHAKEIRVYGRHNLLYPFHLAARITGIEWQQELQKKHPSYIMSTIETPFIYIGGIKKGFHDIYRGNDYDAYSLTGADDKAENRVDFIRPAGDFTIDDLIGTFTQLDSKDFKFQHKREDLQKVLYEWVMLHEARHGDQDRRAPGGANESDADVYAFRILQARGTDPGLLAEAKDIVTHMRAIYGTLGDTGHASTFAMQRGGGTPFDALEDAADFARLGPMIATTYGYNSKAFPEKMQPIVRLYYVAAALDGNGALKEDPGMKKAADAFLSGMRYFDAASGGKVLDGKFDASKISLKFLNAPYHPVTDKLSVPKGPGA